MARKPCGNCQGAQGVRPGGLCNKCYGDSEIQKRFQMARDVTMLPIDQIVVDDSVQARAATRQETVDGYAEQMVEGDEFPPVVVFNDGTTCWLAGGFHRYRARRQAGFKDIAAVVKQGDKRAARLYAIGDNADHGLPRSREDKQRAVRMLLEDHDWGQQSVRFLAKSARVSQHFADKAFHAYHVELAEKASREAESNGEPPPAPVEPKRLGRDGRDYSRQVQNPSAKPAPVYGPGRDAAHLGGEDAPARPPALDGLGKPVPADLAEVFEVAHKYQDLITRLNNLKREVDELKDGDSGAFLAPICQAAVSDLENAKQVLKCAKPYTLCPHCKGQGCAGAKTICKGTGFITEDLFKRLPADMKAWCQDRQGAKP